MNSKPNHRAPAAQQSLSRVQAASTSARLYTEAVRLSALKLLAGIGLTLRTRPGLISALLVVLMSASLWHRGVSYIEEVSSTLVGIRQLLSDDSQHYLDIADDFRDGDFSMSFVAPGGGESADRAHRQPAYPVVLAVAEAAGLSGAPALAKVNLLFVIATLWAAFAVGTWVCASALGGALAAGIIYQADFLFDIATERLLTEPLYVLIATATVGVGLAYLKRKGFGALLMFAALAALAYLTRVNGIFLAAALGIVMIASDVRELRAAEQADHEDEGRPQGGEPESDEDDAAERPMLPLLKYGAAIALFLVVASPSWVPRLIYTGNPVYHGYLNNYLWVDDYQDAHLPGPPRYSWSTYWDDHSVVDAARRLGYGVSRVYWETPRRTIGEGAALVAVIAIVALLAARDAPALWLLVAAILQALPLAWTAMPNDTRRIPAAALLPFFAVLTAAAAARWMGTARQRSAPAQAADDKLETNTAGADRADAAAAGTTR